MPGPGFLGWGLALGEGSGLAHAGAGRLLKLAAEALVLGLQVAEASLKGLAAGTRDWLHTSNIGPVQATAAPPRPRSRDRFQLDTLNKYRVGNFSRWSRSRGLGSMHLEKLGYKLLRLAQPASAGLESNAKSNRAKPGNTDNGHLRPLCLHLTAVAADQIGRAHV